MCIPYPHEACIAWSTVSSIGVLVTVLPLLMLQVLRGGDDVDQEELASGLVIYGGTWLAYVVAIAETYLGVVPAPLDGLLPTSLIAGFVEGFGYLVALVMGPMALMYLVLGLGGLASGITHLLLEEHV
jgi:hypothetical protein